MTTGIRYTRERLAEVAARSSTIDQAISLLGTKPYGNLRRHLYRRFAHFGIDVSHFPRQRRGPATAAPPEKSALQQVVSESVSVAAALRALGWPDTTRQRSLFRASVAAHGIDTSHFLGQGHQRGRPGPTPVKSAEHVLVKREDGRRGKTEVLRRCLRQIGVPEQCVLCGTGPGWLGKPMTLEIDHINGDRSDDHAENLRLLCPNCHAVTATWCRGGNRRTRSSAGV